MPDPAPSLSLELLRLGRRLRELRRGRGWTLEALAAQVGLSKAYLSRLEAGERQASLEVLSSLAAVHSLPLAALFQPASPLPTPGLVAVNIGEPRALRRGTRTERLRMQSAIAKTPVQGTVRLSTSGLEGDAQADRERHGGPERAVCVYPLEHYPFWNARLGRALGAAAFGENFSVWGLPETAARIDDVYRVGSATIQVSAPRGACEKLRLHHDEPRLEGWVNQTGYTGFYCRVLEPGEVHPGAALHLLERRRDSPTVFEAHQSVERA